MKWWDQVVRGYLAPRPPVADRMQCVTLLGSPRVTEIPHTPTSTPHQTRGGHHRDTKQISSCPVAVREVTREEAKFQVNHENYLLIKEKTAAGSWEMV